MIKENIYTCALVWFLNSSGGAIFLTLHSHLKTTEQTMLNYPTTCLREFCMWCGENVNLHLHCRIIPQKEKTTLSHGDTKSPELLSFFWPLLLLSSFKYEFLWILQWVLKTWWFIRYCSKGSKRCRAVCAWLSWGEKFCR